MKFKMRKVRLTMIISVCVLLFGALVFWGIDRMRYQLTGTIEVNSDECVNSVYLGSAYYDEETDVYKNYYFKSHVKENKLEIKMSAIRCDKYKITFFIYVDGKKTSASISYFKHEDLARKNFDVEINITKIGDKYNAELSFDNSKAVLFEDIFSNPIDYYTGP